MDVNQFLMGFAGIAVLVRKGRASGKDLFLVEVTHPPLHSIYASPTSGEAYRDRRLTTNFEF